MREWKMINKFGFISILLLITTGCEDSNYALAPVSDTHQYDEYYEPENRVDVYYFDKHIDLDLDVLITGIQDPSMQLKSRPNIKKRQFDINSILIA